MARKTAFDKKLDRIAELRSCSHDDATERELEKLLADSNALIVSRAAAVVGSREVTRLVPHLVAALERLLQARAKDDKGCLAKEAIAKSLEELRNDAPEPFLAGARHVQLEGTFDGTIDTAAGLRAVCAVALTRFSHEWEAMRTLADLLADPEAVVRSEAARALGQVVDSGTAELLLRLKSQLGDTEEEVVESTFASLLAIDDEYYAFVESRLLKAGSATVRAAAMALGLSQDRARATTVLLNAWEATRGPTRELVLVPLALTKTEEAFAFLCRVVRREDKRYALEALRALSVFPSTDEQRELVREAAEAHVDRAVIEAHDRLF